MSIVLVDASRDSLTISWPEVPGNKSYILQYKMTDNNDNSEWQILSDNLTTPQVRKRNLQSSSRYQFRASADGGTTWITHEQPFALLSLDDEKNRIQAPPRVSLGGTLHSLKIEWDKDASDTTSYEIQMRENKTGMPWSTIANDFPKNEVRKKNLTSNLGYQFRVRSTDSEAFSPPSDPSVALGISTHLQQLFKTLERGTLLRGNSSTSVPLEEALGGKEFVLLYASAHWCGPCRQFTPKLVNWYNALGKSSTVEVVFLSADHDANSFQNYYASMPWLAVDFEDDTRENLMAWIRVTGIPRLAVIDARTGKIIEDNAVGKTLDIHRWRQLSATKK